MTSSSTLSFSLCVSSTRKFCANNADVNYLEETAGGPRLVVATLPNSGKVVLLKVGGLQFATGCGWVRRCDMRHESLTQRALFCIGVNAKKGMLSQHFMMHVVPPLGQGMSECAVGGANPKRYEHVYQLLQLPSICRSEG